MSGVNVQGGRGAETPAPDDLIRIARSAALGDLVPGLVHELNNPLLAIVGMVELLLADADAAARWHRRLGVVHETALEMRSLLRAVRDFAQGSDEPDGRVDLGAAALETLSLVRRTTSAADVELAVDAPSEPVVVPGSRAEIRQALLHLLTNALAAVADGGTVRVSVAQREDGAKVTVADSGPGAPDGVEERIFEPFFSTRPGHAGLGLTAARAIAEGHGGTLELTRANGAGAAFVLTLPAAEGAAE